MRLNERTFDKADWIGQKALLRIRFHGALAVYIGGIEPPVADPSY